MDSEQERERQETFAQYEKFVLQLREEVSQLFFLHNFFFAINSALLGSIFLKTFSPQLLTIVKILGTLLTFYWFSVMSEKNRWREDWLERIKVIENKLSIPENPVNLRMWPKDRCWKGGLSNKLFFWPVIFFGLVWFVLLLFPNLTVLTPDLGASIQPLESSLKKP